MTAPPHVTGMKMTTDEFPLLRLVELVVKLQEKVVELEEKINMLQAQINILYPQPKQRPRPQPYPFVTYRTKVTANH